MKQQKRITLLAGHYGSGKTNIAVNMALALRKNYDHVAIADLDIVNPYFRSKDSADDLARHGIRLICSEYANTNVDIPALPADMYTLIDDKFLHAIVDVGGDDRGALALGRLSDALREENNYDMLMVINSYRPLTRTVDEVLEVMDEIQQACKIPFTGIINNANLGAETTPADVMASQALAQQVAEQTGLPLVMTTVDAALFDDLQESIPNLFPLQLQRRAV